MVSSCDEVLRFDKSALRTTQGFEVGNVLRITVRTLAIRLIVFAFTLVLSYEAPKPGSACVRPHPTVFVFVLGLFCEVIEGTYRELGSGLQRGWRWH